MGRINWIRHKGKRILVADYTGLSVEEQIGTIDETIKVMAVLSTGSELLDIADFTGTPIRQEVRGKLKELATGRQKLKGATVVVGLSGFGKALATLLNPGMKYFDSVEEAKEWLVRQ